MGSQLELGTAIGKIIIDTSGAEGGLGRLNGLLGGMGEGGKKGVDGLGESFTKLGAKVTVAFAPLTMFLKNATESTFKFGESITNVAAVLGLSQDKTKALSDEILRFSKDTRAGPQQVADAFYDIVGGVADASLHMGILTQAVKLSEAGNSKLAGTTSALIAIMNGYGFSANQAGYASDVMTRIVGMGVGTMDDFAAALPNVTGLAHSAGIGFEKVGEMLAFLTTKGTTASEATTQLSSMMIALLKPNSGMSAALEKIGFKTGDAAIKTLGLVGTYKALLKAGYSGDMAALTGRIEALRGVTALTGAGTEEFFKQFEDGINGATDAAQKIQNTSPAAQFDLLRSSAEALAIKIGEKLVPVLVQVFDKVKPIITGIMDWIDKNPELASQVAIFGGALAVIGPILMGVGAAIAAITAAFALLTSPILLIVAGVALVKRAFDTDWMGISTTVKQLAFIIETGFNNLFGKDGTLDQLITVMRVYWNNFWGGISLTVGQIIFLIGYYWDKLFGPNGGLASAIGAFKMIWGAIFDPDPAKGYLAKVWSDLFGENGTLRPIVNSVFDAFDKIFGEKGVLRANWDKVFGPEGFLTKAWAALFGEGTGIQKIMNAAKIVIDGVIKSIGDAVKGVVENVQSVINKVNDAIEAVKRFLGLSSGAAAPPPNIGPPPPPTPGQQGYSTMPIYGTGGQIVGFEVKDGNGVHVGWQDAHGNIVPLRPHDYTGAYDVGQAYLVGKGAQPELFAPGKGGTGMAIPNFDKVMQALIGGGSGKSQDGLVIQQLNVYANSVEQARGAATAFEAELRFKLRKRG